MFEEAEGRSAAAERRLVDEAQHLQDQIDLFHSRRRQEAAHQARHPVVSEWQC